MIQHWVIENGNVREGTFGEWAAFIECCERHVGDTLVGNVRISTVFLGLDHSGSLRENAEPILFETMVFGDDVPGLHPGFWSESMWRYSTLEQAQRGHALAVERVREFLTDAPVVNEPVRLGQLRAGKRDKFTGIIKTLDDGRDGS